MITRKCNLIGINDFNFLPNQQAQLLYLQLFTVALYPQFYFIYQQLEVNSVHSFTRVQLFGPHGLQHAKASLSITNSQSLLKLMPTESVMPSNHLIPYCPLLLWPSIFPSIRVFSNESAFRIKYPKYWSLSFSIQ